MNHLLSSRALQSSGLAGPLRNLAAVVVFMAVVMALSTLGYVAAGWGLMDAVYMVVLTVYTVGYQEVRPVDTPALHVLTIATIILGCTGMIFLTGALVQVFTLAGIRQVLGRSPGKALDKLRDHVIICGFGRIGVMLAKDLADGGAAFMVLERNPVRVAEAEALGYPTLAAEATDEAALRQAGIERARVLATVLPDDAANVFITLTARSLNRGVQIIARGEAPSTESKLLYAGADKVVLPTHIGAERIAELILHPRAAGFVHGDPRMQEFEKVLGGLGVRLEVVTAAVGAAAVGQSLAELERRAKEPVFIVQIDRAGGALMRPPPETRIEPGDGVVVLTRATAATLNALLHAPPERVRAGRSVF